MTKRYMLLRKDMFNRKIITFISMISIVILGAPYYIKHSIEKIARHHELKIDIKSIHFSWQLWKFPSILLKKFSLKNLGKNPTFTNIDAKIIVIEPNYGEFFRSYLKSYNFPIEIKALKVLLSNGSSLEADTISSNVNYKNKVYIFDNFVLYPLKIKLDKNHSSCKDRHNEKACGGHLRISNIKGKGEYHTIERVLHMDFKTPTLSAHNPESMPYAIQAKGKFKYLDLMPYQYAHNIEDPGVRGTITFTVDNFSNLLHQLNQAKFISNMAENLGAIIGYPIPRVDPFTQQSEIFTNAVSLDMNFKADGTYLGKMKL